MVEGAILAGPGEFGEFYIEVFVLGGLHPVNFARHMQRALGLRVRGLFACYVGENQWLRILRPKARAGMASPNKARVAGSGTGLGVAVMDT